MRCVMAEAASLVDVITLQLVDDNGAGGGGEDGTGGETLSP